MVSGERQIVLSPEKQFILRDSYHRGFVQLPRMIIACMGVSPQAKAVYNYLAMYIYEHGKSAFPGIHRIAIGVQMTAKSVVKYIRELVDTGLIKKVRRGNGLTNDYYLIDAHEIGILHVSEMLYDVINSLYHPREADWEKINEALVVLFKTIRDYGTSLADIKCTEEIKGQIKEDLKLILEGGEPKLSYIIPNVQSTTPTAKPSVSSDNKKGKEKIPYFKRDEGTWGTDDFIQHFYDLFFNSTGEPHKVSKTVHRTIIKRTLESLDNNKHELRKYIDAFFEIGYDNKSLEWFGTSGRLAEISLFLRDGKKPFYIDKDNRKNNTAKEAKQENLGISMDEVRKLLGDDVDE